MTDTRHRIRQAFAAAAPAYDRVAGLQRLVCHQLLGVVHRPPPARLLDAGCGTGYARHLLRGRWPLTEWVGCDFAAPMLVGQAPAVCADLTALPFVDASFDLYWSSLAWQWCEAQTAAREAARVLSPGGTLALSTLLPGTLAELEDAFAGLDGHRHVRRFAPLTEILAALAAAGITQRHCHRRRIVRWVPDVASLLRELRTLGAGTVEGRRRSLLGKVGWRTLVARYERHRQPCGLPVTWEILLCTARKPGS